MNRRGFLSTLAGAIAAGADPERLLWTPGAKLISIPPARLVEPWASEVINVREFYNLTTGDVVTFYGDSMRYVIREQFAHNLFLTMQAEQIQLSPPFKLRR